MGTFNENEQNSREIQFAYNRNTKFMNTQLGIDLNKNNCMFTGIELP